MEAGDIFSSVRESINASQRISLACSAARPWTATLPCTMEGEELLLDVPVSYPVHILLKRPRVSFSTPPDSAGTEIHGNGIARVSGGPGTFRVTIIPYRFHCIDPAADPDAAVIELRRNVWQYRQVSASGPHRGRWRLWLRAARPVSFPLSILPVLIGSALALLNGRINLLIFILALVGGVAAHTATNLISDYFDFIKGIDTTNALSSHTGALVDELIEPASIAIAAMTCFLVTAFIGGILAVLVGWPVLLFGAAGMLGGFAYTGGPLPWKYAGLGELSTGFLMGPLMVTGSYFVQTRSVSAPVVLLSIATGLLVSAVSFGNNIRDAFFDRRAGITTMPVKIGAPASVGFFRVLLCAPYLIVGASLLLDFRLLPLSITLVSLPKALSIAGKLGRGVRDFSILSDRASAQILPLQVIRLHRLFCILMLAGAGAAVLFDKMIIP